MRSLASTDRTLPGRSDSFGSSGSLVGARLRSGVESESRGVVELFGYRSVVRLLEHLADIPKSAAETQQPGHVDHLPAAAFPSCPGAKRTRSNTIFSYGPAVPVSY